MKWHVSEINEPDFGWLINKNLNPPAKSDGWDQVRKVGFSSKICTFGPLGSIANKKMEKSSCGLVV